MVTGYHLPILFRSDHGSLFNMNRYIVIAIFIVVPITHGAIPGSFVWKPRMGLDLQIPTTETAVEVAKPNKDNINLGLVVLIDGYQGGLSIIAMAAGISVAQSHPHINPLSAYFYTNAYRWGLRHLSLLPHWLGPKGGSYCGTTKLWKRRYFYIDELVPKWLRYLLPYVKKEEWEKEELELLKYKKFAESAFGKFYRYPNLVFNNFQSMETVETVEDVDLSSVQFG